MAAKPVPDSLPALLAALPSLGPFLSQLSALLTSSAPPGTIFIHAPANSSLLLPLINLIVTQSQSALPSSTAAPSVQELLPKLAVVDLSEVHSTRAAFDRALNSFSGWIEQGEGTGLEKAWVEVNKGVRNWDGRTEGVRVVGKADATGPGKRARGQTSARPAKRQRRTVESDDDLVILPSSTQEEEDEEDVPREEGWAIEWDRTPLAAEKDPVGPIRDTLDHFYLSLKKIMSLGADDTGEEEEERARRWLVFAHAERLHDLPSAGNVGGAPKETGLGMTFASAMYRVGQLVGGNSSLCR